MSRQRKLVFASPHSILDHTSGAAVATLHLLQLMCNFGWQATAFCGSLSDSPLPPIQQTGAGGGVQTTTVKWNDVEIDHFLPSYNCSGRMPVQHEATFLSQFSKLLRYQRPDIVLMYGGDLVSVRLMAICRVFNVPVVFALHNFNYHSSEFFRGVAAILVPSAYCASYYRARLGISPTAIASPIIWPLVERQCHLTQQFVSFVNPLPHKGLFVVASIISNHAASRPDIPFLVVEGRANIGILAQTDLDLTKCRTVYRMRSTSDVREVYSASKLIIMPSVWDESFGRIAAEANINGIPVVASNRGALPEVLGRSGVLLPIPSKITADSKLSMSSEETAPWWNAITRIWDNETEYEICRQRGFKNSQRWVSDNIGKRHDQFFRRILR